MNIGENKETLNNTNNNLNNEPQKAKENKLAENMAMEEEVKEMENKSNTFETAETTNETFIQPEQAYGSQPVYGAQAPEGEMRVNPQTEKAKKKRDPVKWIAVALAAVFASTTVLSASALNKVKLSGSTLTGTVSSVSSGSITLTLSESSARSGFFGMPGNMQGGNFGGMQQGTPPDMQNRDSENRTENSNENNSSDSESRDGQQSEENGAPNQGQMPNGESEMNGNFNGFEKSQKGESAGEITVKLSLLTSITNGSEKISISDIEQGDTVTVTFGALNSAKSVVVSDTDSTNSFGNMQGGNFGSMQQTPPDMQNGESDNTTQNAESPSDSGSQT